MKEPPYANIARSISAAANAAGTKADALAIIGGRAVMTDTKVIHPAAATYRRVAARKNGAAAERAERAKWLTFRANGGADSGSDFVPCVVESVGRVGPEFRKFINKMGSAVAQGGGCKAAFVRQTYAEISCAMARGNARMFVAGLCARLRKAGAAFQPAFDTCISGPCEA